MQCRVPPLQKLKEEFSEEVSKHCSGDGGQLFQVLSPLSSGNRGWDWDTGWFENHKEAKGPLAPPHTLLFLPPCPARLGPWKIPAQ